MIRFADTDVVGNEEGVLQAMPDTLARLPLPMGEREKEGTPFA